MQSWDVEKIEALLSPRRLQAFLRERGMTARHGLGQNFLVSRHILERIVATAAVQPGEDVLEIGPGFGFLTHFLLSAGARVRAYETDAALCDWLAGVFHGVPAFDLVRGDFLQADCSLYGASMDGAGDGNRPEDVPQKKAAVAHARVIANLPYNITTPVFDRLFSLPAITEIIVMVQRQVAERIVAKPATREYGALTLFAGFHSESELLFHVSPGNFHPAPSVYSSVVRLRIRREKPLAGEAARLFFALGRAVFSSRRKVLRNSLRESPFCGLNGEQADRLLELAGILGGIRGEEMSMDEFVVMARAWESSGLPRPRVAREAERG